MRRKEWKIPYPWPTHSKTWRVTRQVRISQDYEKAKGIDEKEAMEDTISMAMALGNIVTVYQQQGKFGLALKDYEKAKGIFEKEGMEGTLSMAITIKNIANVYQQQSKFELALEYYKKAKEVHETHKMEDTIYMAEALYNMGSLYLDQNNKEPPQKYLSNSFAILVEVGDEIEKVDKAEKLAGEKFQKEFSWRKGWDEGNKSQTLATTCV